MKTADLTVLEKSNSTVWLALYNSLGCQYSGNSSDFVVVVVSTVHINFSCKNPGCDLSLCLWNSPCQDVIAFSNLFRGQFKKNTECNNKCLKQHILNFSLHPKKGWNFRNVKISLLNKKIITAAEKFMERCRTSHCLQTIACLNVKRSLVVKRMIDTCCIRNHVKIMLLRQQ